MNPNDGDPAEIADECYFYSGVPTGMRFNLTYLWNRKLNGCTL
jgi:hypothetical protein